jgi:hypothetical protein
MSDSTKKYWDEHPEQKAVLSQIRKGVKLSPETCERISKGTRGSHTMSDEHKKRLIDISRTRVVSDEERQLRRDRMTGFRHSEETIQRCRAAKREYWKKVKAGEIVAGAIPRDDKGKYARKGTK